MNSRDVLKRLQDDGWAIVAIKGSHHQLKHSTKPGRVTLPHPKKDLAIGVVKSIEKQSGIKLT